MSTNRVNRKKSNDERKKKKKKKKGEKRQPRFVRQSHPRFRRGKKNSLSREDENGDTKIMEIRSDLVVGRKGGEACA